MRISEIFYSIQGEGRLIGVPSVFIRTSGCNLRCRWCDTPYTSWAPEGKNRTVKSILAEIAQYPSRHVVITGGEPLLAPDLAELASQLKQRGAHITIETAATIFKPLAGDLISLSPKLANSTPWQRSRGKFAAMHDKRRLNYEVMQKYIDGYDYQLKFVVERKKDLDEVRAVIGQLRNVDSAKVMLMAQGIYQEELVRKAQWIVESCRQYGYSYTPRLHIQLFGNRRGT
ncbi:MAG TPA: 7-carboxy-7-deazaguanine synthase QueE [Candidatus Binatia bacterium]|nr:7-carboxy-7-deazaguanine synthase QueE [Candidatus Binatia bacterium]